jgi:hypothetical protein
MNERQNRSRIGKDQDDTWEDSTAEKELKREERSLDIGEEGQFAPGGYYNQLGVDAPDRSALDDDIVPPARGSGKRDVE